MTIELPATVAGQLRDLAERQGRHVNVLVEEAVRQYLEAAAITDLDAEDIAEAQVALAREMSGVPAWKGPRG